MKWPHAGCCICLGLWIACLFMGKRPSRDSVQQPGSILRSLLSTLLLLIYLVGSTGTDFIHHAVHQHTDAEVHSADAENDPCHRAVVHGDRELGCDHHAHFTEVPKCKHGHLVFQANQLLLEANYAEAECTRTIPSLGVESGFSSPHSQQLRLRGPPLA